MISVATLVTTFAKINIGLTAFIGANFYSKARLYTHDVNKLAFPIK